MNKLKNGIRNPEPPTVDVRINCVFCAKTFKVKKIPMEGLHNWRRGELIQNALPTLNSTDRESLISQICPECQDEVFK